MKRFPIVVAIAVLVIAIIAGLAIMDSDSDVPEPYGGTYDRRGSYEPATDVPVADPDLTDADGQMDASDRATPSGAEQDSVPLRPGEVRIGSGLRPVTGGEPATGPTDRDD